MRGDKSPLTIGILLTEWLCASNVRRFRIRHHNESHPAYQSGAKPHHVKNSHLPPKPKLPHKTPAIKKAKQIIALVMVGVLWGSSGKVREVWRVGNPLRKRVSCASKVFLFSKVFPFLPPHPNVSTQKSESSSRRRTVTSSRSSPSAAPTCRLSQRRLPSRRKPRPA